MNGIYRTIARRIRVDLQELARVVERIGRIWQQALAATDDYYVDATALNLHGFYAGLERLLEIIAEGVGRAKRAGSHWHGHLLRQMAAEVPGVRPPDWARGHERWTAIAASATWFAMSTPTTWTRSRSACWSNNSVRRWRTSRRSWPRSPISWSRWIRAVSIASAMARATSAPASAILKCACAAGEHVVAVAPNAAQNLPIDLQPGHYPSPTRRHRRSAPGLPRDVCVPPIFQSCPMSSPRTARRAMMLTKQVTRRCIGQSSERRLE